MKTKKLNSKFHLGVLSVIVFLTQGVGATPVEADESLALKLKNPSPLVLLSESEAESLEKTLNQALTLTERVNAGLTQGMISSRAPYYLEDASLGICLEISDTSLSQEEVRNALDSPTHCNEQGLCVKKIPR